MDFIESLRSAIPSREACLAVGMDAAELQWIHGKYVAPLREAPLPLADEANNPLLRLMAEWDFGKLAVGMIWFNSEPVKDQIGNWILGKVEVDNLLLIPSGKIQVFEKGVGRPLWPVAANSQGLMASLPLAARFLGRCAVDEIDWEDIEAAQKTARECAEAAGGKEYLNFYLMLLGAHP